jgi:hypothetical protein
MAFVKINFRSDYFGYVIQKLHLKGGDTLTIFRKRKRTYGQKKSPNTNTSPQIHNPFEQ